MQRIVPPAKLCYSLPPVARAFRGLVDPECFRMNHGRSESSDGVMRFERFQAVARQLWHEIPPEYKAGVEGVVVERRAVAHPKLRDIYTMGECLTESYPSSFEGPETLRSVVVLYHGSFERLSRLDPDFDWEGELWETLTHELRHHLESLAAEDALEDVDYAADENFKRLEGQPYDPYFFRAGERVEEGVYVVENDVFIERERPRAGEDVVEFTYGRLRYRAQAPAEHADVWMILLTSGISCAGEAWLVLTHRPGFVESVRALVQRRKAVVRETESVAERVR